MKDLLPKLALQKDIKIRLSKLALKLKDSSITFLHSGLNKQRNSDNNYPFRVDSNFYYLTGISQPNSIFVLIKTKQEVQTLLFLTQKDKQKEQWEGEMLGLSQARNLNLFDEVLSLESFDAVILDKLARLKRIYFCFAQNELLLDKLVSFLKIAESSNRYGSLAPSKLINLTPTMAGLRMIKSEYELNIIKKACQIANHAHVEAKDLISQCTNEKQVQAIIEAIFIRDADGMSYNSIVATGENACVLHYNKNNADFLPNSLVLIDAGCEFEGYAADITTTIPSRGNFTEQQQAVYNLVAKTKKAVIEIIKPGVSMLDLQQKAIAILSAGLIDLSIIEPKKYKLDTKTNLTQQVIDKQIYKEFYPHSIGHHLGLDVHDTANYYSCDEMGEMQAIKLEPNMVLTIEPGIYLSSKNDNLDKKWHAIAVRLEDDVVVTKNGCVVLNAQDRKL